MRSTVSLIGCAGFVSTQVSRWMPSYGLLCDMSDGAALADRTARSKPVTAALMRGGALPNGEIAAPHPRSQAMTNYRYLTVTVPFALTRTCTLLVAPSSTTATVRGPASN